MYMNKLALKITSGTLLVLLVIAGLPRSAQTATSKIYTVTKTTASGSGSLRQAIIDANNHPSPDTIKFNIPKSDPGYYETPAQWVINPGPGTELPALTDGGTTIDGTTQTSNVEDTNQYGPEVAIGGFALPGPSSIFNLTSDNNVISGLEIYQAPDNGILISSGATGNTIKGNYININLTGVKISSGAKDNILTENVISGNYQNGILITDNTTSGNQIRKNYIGLDDTGIFTNPNNWSGIKIDSSKSNIIGGVGNANYIGGNKSHGVHIVGGGADGNSVTHNFIGVDIHGTSPVGNHQNGILIEGGAKGSWIRENIISGNKQNGVLISGSGTENSSLVLNIIGANVDGTGAISNGWHGVGIYAGAKNNSIDSNIVVGSGYSGVVIVNPGTDSNNVKYNHIGIDINGALTDLGNYYYGVHIVEGANNVIQLNHIAYNGITTGAAGVQVQEATAIKNKITRNSIHNNGGFGIKLINGGNTEIPAPAITLVDCEKIEGTTGAGWSVEVFSDTEDEGWMYEGKISAHTIQPTFSWIGRVSGPFVTVTATDTQGNTSQFSAPVKGGCHYLNLPVIPRNVN